MISKSWDEMSKREKIILSHSIRMLYGESSLPKPDLAKPRKKRTYPEYQIQCEVVSYCKRNGIEVMKLHNEGKRSAIAGAREKAAGLRAGASDLFLPEPNNYYHGFFIELKAPSKKPTPLQSEFMQKMREKGYKADWFDNATLAIAAITQYFQHV